MVVVSGISPTPGYKFDVSCRVARWEAASQQLSQTLLVRPIKAHRSRIAWLFEELPPIRKLELL